MSYTTIIIAVALILLVMGAIMGPGFIRRKRSQRFQDEFGHEYDHTVNSTGSEKKAQAELDERRKHVGTLNIRPLSVDERKRYLDDWTAVQAKFVDEPGEATVAANHLVTQVMRARDYPVSDFEQRAADISISYPSLVTNYRAARAIAVKNENKQADTEELRHALIYYRNLFKELLGTDAVKKVTGQEKAAQEDKQAREAEKVTLEEKEVVQAEAVSHGTMK